MTTTESPATERTGSILRHTMKKEQPAPVARTGLKRNAAGHDLGTVDLEPTVFGLTPNRAVLHQVVTAQLAAVRAGTQSTKTRAEVRGGGAKPFRQKGTGRARQGSSRSPSMSGGGVALGPKPRSYEQRTPKKMIRLALLSALSDMAETGHVIVLDDWQIEEPDTRAAAVILQKLRIKGTVLAVLANDEIDVALSLAQHPRGLDHDARRALGPRRGAGRLAALHRAHRAHLAVGLLGHRTWCRSRRSRRSPGRRRAGRGAGEGRAGKKAGRPPRRPSPPRRPRPPTSKRGRRGRRGAGRDGGRDGGGPDATEAETTEAPAKKKAAPRRARAAKKAKEGDTDA